MSELCIDIEELYNAGIGNVENAKRLESKVEMMRGELDFKEMRRGK